MITDDVMFTVFSAVIVNGVILFMLLIHSLMSDVALNKMCKNQNFNLLPLRDRGLT